jgi:hypothetical protein
MSCDRAVREFLAAALQPGRFGPEVPIVYRARHAAAAVKMRETSALPDDGDMIGSSN